MLKNRWPGWAANQAGALLTPRDIPGLVLWLTAGVGFAPNQWSDRSLFNHHMLQPTGPNQPTTDAIPGFQTVNFDGSVTWMSSVFALVQPQTLVMCIAPQVSAGGTSPFDGIPVLSMGLYHSSTTAHSMFSQSGSGSGSQTVGPIADNVYRIWTFQYNGASSFMRQNATQSPTGAINLPEGAIPANGVTLGGLGNHGAQFKMGLAEFAVFNRSLSATEMHQVEAYMATPRGITIAP